ncbi:cysteine hydrolase family protein [Schlesneria paludicola]|uniref:cysteine hydrolase family protein n=1 Tax=Schlesneria paludicola TaxID=360056 RepID=UPI00029A1E36|nr:isochorismatase family cysteine hydrolase [Schlesneria paludicola]
MPAINPDLHGNAPDKCGLALLLIDVINDFDFPEGEQLLSQAQGIAPAIARLAQKARSIGVPVHYVNDNFGRWRSDLRAQIAHCLHDEGRGENFVRQLRPEEGDYFVLKPKHSGFFSTTLETLLRYHGAERLIVTGIATNIRVLFTPNDAYMRDFSLIVPSDCVASNTTELNRFALDEMRTILKADLRRSDAIELRQKT